MDAAKLRRHERQGDAEKQLLQEERDSHVFENQKKQSEAEAKEEQEVCDHPSLPAARTVRNVKKLDIILLDGTWSQ